MNKKAQEVLDSMNEWLKTPESAASACDVIEWRNGLAEAIHQPTCPVVADGERWDAPCQCGAASE